MLALSITKPCHENWEDMIPGDHGAYCKSCCKNVIDFTSMGDEEIFDYFQKKKNEPVCGKFRNDQLNRPIIEISPEVFIMRIPFWQKFLAALLIYFSSFISGCSSDIQKDYTDLEVPTTHSISPKPAKANDAAVSKELISQKSREPVKKNKRTSKKKSKLKYSVNLIPESAQVKIDWQSLTRTTTLGFVTALPTLPTFPVCPPFPELYRTPSQNKK